MGEALAVAGYMATIAAEAYQINETIQQGKRMDKKAEDAASAQRRIDKERKMKEDRAEAAAAQRQLGAQAQATNPQPSNTILTSPLGLVGNEPNTANYTLLGG